MEPNPAQPAPPARVLLEGRYRKFVRDLPQTVFFCPRCKGRRGGCAHCGGFGKLTRDSVQELIARRVLPRFRARKGKFHGAGREDLDVRMLGGGRPFVYEVLKPRELAVDLAALARDVNELGAGRIEVTALVPVPRGRVAELKETRCDKVYRALVSLPAARLDAVRARVGQDLEVTQRTPQRVAHRRADKERVRRVTVLSLEPFEDAVEVTLRCQHGTYVKEWISGEEGRSTPSLAELGGAAVRCLALDVVDVLGPFPPLEGREAPTFSSDPGWPLPPALAPSRWALRDDAVSGAAAEG
ncbi:MAG: tRNA pseudouridine(54/55) synthase Pus10 [Planctomycetota bacterium]